MSDLMWESSGDLGIDVLDAIPRIKSLIKRNKHSDAYVLGATVLGVPSLAKKFELVAEIVKLEGFMPRPIGDYQFETYEDMLLHAKQHLEGDVYNSFKAAF
jgi:hypothetical protein